MASISKTSLRSQLPGKLIPNKILLQNYFGLSGILKSHNCILYLGCEKNSKIALKYSKIRMLFSNISNNSDNDRTS